MVEAPSVERARGRSPRHRGNPRRAASTTGSSQPSDGRSPFVLHPTTRLGSPVGTEPVPVRRRRWSESATANGASRARGRPSRLVTAWSRASRIGDLSCSFEDPLSWRDRPTSTVAHSAPGARRSRAPSPGTDDSTAGRHFEPAFCLIDGAPSCEEPVGTHHLSPDSRAGRPEWAVPIAFEPWTARQRRFTFRSLFKIRGWGRARPPRLN